MICQRCLHRASPVRAPFSLLRRITSSTPSSLPSTPSNPTSATSNSLPQAANAPVSSESNTVTLGKVLRPKTKSAGLPKSIAPAGTPLKGLNYLKGRDDPRALSEEEYPEWLWRCLDSTSTKGKDGEGAFEGDEYSKSKKVRRMAAKRQRKLEQRLLASGDTESFAPKIPLQRQTIDLPSNEEGGVDGALFALGKRAELTKAMRVERREKIKERNFLGTL